MQKINLTPKFIEKNHVILPYFEGEFKVTDAAPWASREIAGEFKGESGEIMMLVDTALQKKRWLLGLGKRNNADQLINPFRKVIGLNNKTSGKIVVKADLFNEEQLELCITGLHYAGYTLQHFKKENQKTSDKTIEVYAPQKFAAKVFQRATAIALASHTAMDLVNLPSNVKNPSFLADFAKKSGSKHGYHVKATMGKALLKSGMKALYEVGKGSQHEPAFIQMEYKPKKVIQYKIAFVGKGITFDTGGVSLKNSSNMHYMKSDMAGAAAVIGLMEAVSKLELPIHLMGIIPSAENAIGSNAYKPGDVISSYSGKSIEVIDTDAEGRLVLADGLSYTAKTFKPDYIIDLATLTGSCIATLGYAAAGMFTQDDDLANELFQSGKSTGEKVWRLPLWDDYKSLMASDIADIKNLSSLPVAGAITAAKFLEAFTENHAGWAHLDIAGVSFTDSEYYKSRTATGYGVRLLAHWLLSKCRK